jgi:putative ABC transport system permease protein
MIHSLRLATRTLRRQPGFTVLAVAILTLGLGVTTTMFSLVNTVLLRPLPYPDSGQLVRVYRTAGTARAFAHSVPSLREQREQNTVFEGMAGFSWRNFSLAEAGGAPERLQGMSVTADFFSVLKAQPQLGRLFRPDEDRHLGNQVVVLAHELWQGRFGGDPGIVGRRLRLDGEAVTVVGVMPPSMSHVVLWGPVALWRPAGFSPDRSAARNDHSLHVFARLKPGVSLGEAQAHLNVLAARLDRQHRTGSGLRLVPLNQSTIGDAGARLSWLTMGLAMFVILIVCTNLAGVQLARLAGRGHEHAIRIALGATRGRLIGQLLTESLLLSVVGGALGILLARWLSEMLGRLIFVGHSRIGLALPLDGRVVGFAAALVLLATFAVGTVPAWLSARAAVSDGLRRGGRGTTDQSQPRLRQALVVAQMALALVLLTAGGLFVRGLQRYAASDPGWQMDGVMTARLTLPAAKYSGAEARAAFLERLQFEVARVPGVAHSALSWSLPIGGYGATASFLIEGAPTPQPGQEPLGFVNGVTPDFFGTLGVPLREGRGFTTADGAGAPSVAIINEAMARQHWAGGTAIGKRIRDARGEAGWLTIVGVMADVHFPANPNEPITRNQVYHPLAQGAQSSVFISLRGGAEPESLQRELRAAMARVDAELPLYEVRTARQAVSDQLANFELIVWILVGFSLLGLLLAALGVYGLFSGLVVQRTREIGVRVALGADRWQVLWLVMRKGLRLALLAAVLGAAAAMLLSPVLASVASGLPPHEPAAIIVMALGLVAVALLACWLPASRAAALDPMVALRQD